MTNAVRLTRWLAQEHYRVVCSCMNERGIDTTGQATDITDRGGLEEEIMLKLRHKGPQTPRDLQRSFHQTSAKERDEALQKLKTQGRVVETADGKLALPA